MERGPGCWIHGWRQFCSWLLGVPQGQQAFFLISWWLNAGLKDSSFQLRLWPPWIFCLDFSSSSSSPPSFRFLLCFHCGITYVPLDVLISKCMIQWFLINMQLSQFNFSTFWSHICSHFWFLFGNGKPGSSSPTISWESWPQRKEPRGSSFK